jgi:putative transposase
MSTWRQSWSAATWRNFLEEGESQAEIYSIRRSTRAGRPLGAEEFTRALEQRTQRRLTPGPRGRPRKTPGAENPRVVPRQA